MWLRFRASKLKTLSQFADQIGTDKSTLHRLLFGDRKPGRALAGLIALRLDIALPLWEEAPRREFTLTGKAA
jgi:transcriptional regulator with XRE-family HTH domain